MSIGEILKEQETIVVGARIIKGKVHCVNCGRYVDGHVFLGGGRFVCNVQCGIDFIAKADKQGKGGNNELVVD